MSEKPIKGGEFLIRDTQASDIFIPENWTEEQRMISDMCDDFIRTEIEPNLDRIDSMEDGLKKNNIKKDTQIYECINGVQIELKKVESEEVSLIKKSPVGSVKNEFSIKISNKNDVSINSNGIINYRVSTWHGLNIAI